jgi:hypothetical protein
MLRLFFCGLATLALVSASAGLSTAHAKSGYHRDRAHLALRAKKAPVRHVAQQRRHRQSADLRGISQRVPVHYLGQLHERQYNWAYAKVMTKDVLWLYVSHSPDKHEWAYSPFSANKVPIYYVGAHP